MFIELNGQGLLMAMAITIRSPWLLGRSLSRNSANYSLARPLTCHGATFEDANIDKIFI